MVLEGASDAVVDRILEIRAGVNDMEILPPSLPYHARITQIRILRSLNPNLPQQTLKNLRAPRKIQSCEMRTLEYGFGDIFRVPGEELYHILGKSRFEEDLVEEPRRVEGVEGRFPQDHIPH